jgi:hypothetical protein
MTTLVPVQRGEVACIPDLEMTMRIGLLFHGWAGVPRRAGCVAALCLLTAACSTAPGRPFSGPDPSDPGVGVPATAYRSALSGYTSQRPVEPAPWREQNERVTPTPKR